MAKRKKLKFNLITIILLILALIGMLFYSNSTDLKKYNHSTIIKHSDFKEADYVNMYCKGIIEYKLPDRTRVDCLTDEYAIEFDWAKKWAESIGQALYYSKMTGKKPAVAIIIKNPYERVYIERIKKVDKNIKIFEIKSKDFNEY